MALDDLDLEFEDEDEIKKKKSEAVLQDVDLEFHVEGSAKPQPVRAEGDKPAEAAASVQSTPTAEVKNISEARAAKPQVVQSAVKSSAGSVPRSVGATAMKASPEVQMEVDNDEIVKLRERNRQLEIDSEVRALVAESKIELLSELLSDIKLMDHQVNQMLIRINAKHPDMKNEVLMIKKILADFTAKKRK